MVTENNKQSEHRFRVSFGSIENEFEYRFYSLIYLVYFALRSRIVKVESRPFTYRRNPPVGELLFLGNILSIAVLIVLNHPLFKKSSTKNYILKILHTFCFITTNINT